MCQKELPQFIKELEQDVGPNVCPQNDWCEKPAFSPTGYFPAFKAINSPKCPAFVPTRHELMVLAVHWFMKERSFDFGYFCGESFDHDDQVVWDTMDERLELLGETLDEEARNEVLAAAERECRERWGDEWFAYEAAVKAYQERDW